MVIERLQAVSEAVKRKWREFWEMGLVNERMLQNYFVANDESLHSRLQGLTVLAGWDSGLVAFPEVKVRLQDPIDRRALGDIRSTQRYLRTVTVDVGYFDGPQFVGVCEVITLDMLSGANPKLPGITPYHKLRHLARDKCPFILIVAALPQQVLKAPYWEDWKEWHNARSKSEKADFVERQWEHWVRLSEELRCELRCQATCVRLMEGGSFQSAP